MPLSLLLILLLAQATIPGPAQTAPETPVMPEPIVAPLRDAAVTLECSLQTNGGLSNCRVVSETPSGHGLGARALTDARRTRYARPSVASGRDGPLHHPLSLAGRRAGPALIFGPGFRTVSSGRKRRADSALERRP
jgi:hypothetical protein